MTDSLDFRIYAAAREESEWDSDDEVKYLTEKAQVIKQLRKLVPVLSKSIGSLVAVRFWTYFGGIVPFLKRGLQKSVR